MPGSLGTISGRIRLDVANAIAGFAAVRAATATTVGTMNAASVKMKAVGVASVAMGALFLVGFGKAVSAAADFEKKMDYFGAVNKATAGEMEKVRAKALELGRTSQFSAGQIADAFVEMGKAGVSAKDITDGMAQSMVNLASAADIDLAQATNIVTSIVQAYSLKATDARHVTDELAGAANASIVDVEDLGVSFKYVAGVAHSLGISMDSTTTALSLLGKAGIKGSTAGTSLRQIMVSLAGSTDKAKGQLEDLGIITADGSNKFFDAQGHAKSLSEVFQILQDATAGLTDKQRLMAFKTIFNNRALAAASILTKEGAKGFKEMNGEISKTTAADVAAKRLDNLSGDIKKLKGNIETMLIKGGTPFQKFLRTVVQSLTKLVQAFGKLPESVQTGFFAFLGIAGVALIFAGGIALMGAALTGAGGSFKLAWAALKILAVALRAVAVATWEVTVAALANPYVLLAIAIVALIVGLVILYKKSETFRNILATIGNAVKTGFMAVVNWFKGLPAFFSGVWDSITKAFSQGVAWVIDHWNKMVDFITSAPGKIRDSIMAIGTSALDFLKGIPGQVGGFITTAWSNFMTFLSNLPAQLGYALGFLIGTLVKWGIGMMLEANRIGAEVYNAVVGFFQRLPGQIWNFLVQAWNFLVTWGTNMYNSSTKAAVDAYNAVVTWFQKLPGRIWDFLVDMKNKAVNAYNNMVAATVVFAVNSYNSVVTWFQKLPGRIWDFLVSTKNNVVNMGANIVSSASSMASKAYHAVINSLSNLPGQVWNILGNVVGQFNNMVRSAYNSAADFAGGLWDGFKDGLGIHSPSYIERAMFAISDTTARESTKLKKQVRGMQGLAKGLQEVQNTVGASGTPPDWAMQAAKSLQSQSALAMTLNPTAGQLSLAGAASSSASSTSQTGSEAVGDQRPITVTVNNPIAERASDSAARKLRTLSSLGAF